MIETLDDIIEELADKFGIYGTHPAEGGLPEECKCRICFCVWLKNRIERAVRETCGRVNMLKVGTVIQRGKVEVILNDETFVDEHPEIKNITCSLFELSKTGLPLFLTMLTGKNEGRLRSLVRHEDIGIYAVPQFPNPLEVGDGYVVIAMA